jgi:hypothetical protein
VTTPDAKNYAYPASLGGSVGFGMMMTNVLAPALGSLLATLAGAVIAAAAAVVIYYTVDLFTKRGTIEERTAEYPQPTSHR